MYSMPCSYFGGAEDRWKYYSILFIFDGRRNRENGARVNAPVRGKGINLARRYGHVSRAGYPGTAALYAQLVCHEQAPG